MTETNEIKTAGINALVTGKEEGREVLLVGLKAAYQDKPQYQKALKREFDQCHETEHPHILRYLELKEVAGFGHCIVMEWEPARPLSDYMQEAHTEEEKKKIVRQVAEVVGFMHRMGKVHGALTPAVVFVTTKGDEVKVLNFRLRYADNLNEPAATLKFRAPEAKDGTVAIDPRADIFSLGVMVREMGLGDDYQQVVAGCCSYGRSERYADVDAFLDALEHRHYSRSTARSSSSGNKKLAILMSAVVAVLAVAVLLWFNKNNETAGMAQPTSELADSVQAAPGVEAAAANTPAETAQPTDDAPATSEQATSAGQTGGKHTGDMEFLNRLVPQMHIDLDKIYARGGDAAAVHRRVAAYYKGLRRTLGNLSQEQFAAFDEAFASYVTAKKAGQEP